MDVSVDRLKSDVSNLAFVRHPDANPGGLQKAMDYIWNEMVGSGCYMLDQSWRTGKLVFHNVVGEKAAGFNFPPTLWEPSVIAALFSQIATSGVDPRRLVLEITESAAMREDASDGEILSMIAESGIQLAIDDFGTGYSSLSRLRDLPATTLKIDRTFVRDLPADGSASAMTVAIIQLAHNLGLQPLAEGVETVAQAEFLSERACRLGQGFLFSRPVTAAEVEHMWRSAGRRAA